jgi:hypothetical protein
MPRCPVCEGRRETAPGQGCGACAATGFIAWPWGVLNVAKGTAVLEHGAAVVRVPAEFTADIGLAGGVQIQLTIQEARGAAGAVYVSDRAARQFTIASLSERDESLVGWLIIG